MDAQQATENFFRQMRRVDKPNLQMTTLIGLIAGLSLAAFLLIWIVAALRR